MKTQISRDSLARPRRYSRVLQQQGRMLTDADWNEMSTIVKERLDDVLRDVIGSGTPQGRGLLTVTPGPGDSETVELVWGHAYVDGITAQVRPDGNGPDPGPAFDYLRQADFPSPTPLPGGDHRLYLDVWERSVSSLEDGGLRDPGLHGADTCTRSQTMAQVKWCPVDADPEDPLQNPPQGDAILKLELLQGSTEPDACDPCADELQLQERVGNYLFRVEVHHVEYDNAGRPERIVLKWSSENGAEQHVIGSEPPGFKAGGWIFEFFSGESEQYASEKHLGFHMGTDPGWDPVRGQLFEEFPDAAPGGASLVRRWDGYVQLVRDGADNWSLESEVAEASNVVSGMDRGVRLSTTNSANAPGHVEVGAAFSVNLDALALTLDLSNRMLVAGDFWYAEVREAVHDAGDAILEGSVPMGIRHHYMTLATVEGGGISWYRGDQCKRAEFPPLTDLRADDICFSNDVCNMPTANTVQDAIDRLCQERDLRFHNKHLHGWGIVCGLQVECGPDTAPPSEGEPERRQVTVRKGYALDCEGNDIRLGDSRVIDLIELVDQAEAADPATPLLDDNDDGTVCMTLGLNETGEIDIGVEPYGTDTPTSLLKGTLWMNFYEDCIKSFVDAIKEELDSENGEGEDRPVGPARRRLTSLLNLLVQLFNTSNGQYVFLSPQEHQILRSFYLRLRELLQSKTFCAMFAGGDFPEYPFPETEMNTIFGKGNETRLKIHPDGDRAYGFGGNDDKIHVYDLDQGELIEVVTMPAGEGAEVQDIVFSADGNRLFAAAHLRGTDTMFGVADITANGHNWGDMSVLCDLLIMEMVRSESDDDLIYATGRGRGLFKLRPGLLFEEEKPRPDPTYPFNAVGHLEVDENRSRAYATAAIGEEEDPESYGRIAVLDLDAEDGSLPIVQPVIRNPFDALSATGNDDIALQPGNRLYVVADVSGGKRLLTYDLQSLDSGQETATAMEIEDTSIRLAYHDRSQQLLMTVEDGYRLQAVDQTGTQTLTFRHPVQIAPMCVVVHPDRDRVYVLNQLSSTLSEIPDNAIAADTQFLETLADYRTEIIQSFIGLLGGLLQYFKDCFCHQLLVDCPTCEEDDKIYLACVEIRGDQVYNVCNFSKRKYVKSFPTVEYWMSMVPIMPVLGKALEKFCCWILPDVFGDVEAPRDQESDGLQGSNRIRSSSVSGGLRTFKRTNFTSLFREQRDSLGISSQFLGDSFRQRFDGGEIAQANVSKTAVANTPVEEAQAHLDRSGITVESVEAYDPVKSADNMVAFGRTPARIPRGSKVTLVEKDGRVMFFKMSPPPVEFKISDADKAQIEALAVQREALADTSDIDAELARIESKKKELGDVDVIKGELDTLAAEREAVQQQLSDLNAEVAALKTERSALTQASSQLKVDLAELQSTRASAEESLVNLKADLDGVTAMQKDLSQEIAKGRPVKDVEGVTEEIDGQLRDMGIRTVEELANANPKEIGGAGKSIDVPSAEGLVGAAQSRLNPPK